MHYVDCSKGNPGSAAAIQAGCTCDRKANFTGWGFDGTYGHFDVNLECPVHGPSARGEVIIEPKPSPMIQMDREGAERKGEV